MKFIGKLVSKFDYQQGENEKGTWARASYLLETVESYPKHLAVKVIDGLSNRIAQFDALMGKNVVVYYDIDAHEYQGRWFNDMTAFGIQPCDPEPPKEQ